MITNEIIIDLKDLSENERKKVRNILVKNYIKLLDAIEKEADYCTVDAYWKDFTPISKPIIKGRDFIAKNS